MYIFYFLFCFPSSAPIPWTLISDLLVVSCVVKIDALFVVKDFLSLFLCILILCNHRLLICKFLLLVLTGSEAFGRLPRFQYLWVWHKADLSTAECIVKVYTLYSVAKVVCLWLRVIMESWQITTEDRHCYLLSAVVTGTGIHIYLTVLWLTVLSTQQSCDWHWKIYLVLLLCKLLSYFSSFLCWCGNFTCQCAFQEVFNS